MFRNAAQQRKIVFQLNFTIDPDSVDRWNTDLVVGPPNAIGSCREDLNGRILRGDLRELWIGIDAKTIMTEHGKARRNRQRDLNSFQNILHHKNPNTIVGGLVVVNMARRFQTPLARQEPGPTEHKNIERLVEEIVAMLNGLARAEAKPGKQGLEALGVIVVEHSNIAGDTTRLVEQPPAPGRGHALNYETFLRELCEAFTIRFG
ncbi:MAG: hypothetical protein U0587_03565 [Candidatus Binatia bacterium]